MLTDVEKAERILKGQFCHSCFEPFLVEPTRAVSAFALLSRQSASDPEVCLYCHHFGRMKETGDNNAN